MNRFKRKLQLFRLFKAKFLISLNFERLSSQTKAAFSFCLRNLIDRKKKRSSLSLRFLRFPTPSGFLSTTPEEEVSSKEATIKTSTSCKATTENLTELKNSIKIS